MSKRPLLCLIDASSLIFRAYYAVRPLSNKAGLPTNAIFGFGQMLLGLLQDLKPDYIAVVYDTKYPSFRKERYPLYKANRAEMPDDLVPQMPYIKKLVESIALPSFEMPGFEADDIIATLADECAHQGKDAEVYIISSDKDLLQLVNERVKLYDTMKNVKLGPKEVQEKLGVPPELVADYLGIVGDSSDNIPGVKGIGPKGAVALLQEFGSVEAIYQNLSKVKKDTQRKLLEDSRENALLSKELATVKRDVEIGRSWRELLCQPQYGEKLKILLEELEFHQLLKRVQWDKGSSSPYETEEQVLETAIGVLGQKMRFLEGDQVADLKPCYKAIGSLEELKAAFASLSDTTRIAIDTETTGLHIHDSQIVGFSFCGSEREAFYVPLNHRDELGIRLGAQCNPGEALCQFAGFLSDKKLIAQNIKFDWNILRSSGVELRQAQVYFDPMIASYLLNPEARHGLDQLADLYLGHKNISYEELCGSGKNQITFDRVPIDRAAQYAAEDAHVAFLLARVLEKEVTQIPSVKEVMAKIELPLAPVLADLEWEGISIDVELLRKLSSEFARDLERLEREAYILAGEEFNLSSPKQLQKILFEKLALPAAKKTKTGYSTDVEVLEKLRAHHALPGIILDHRELSKLKGTYVDVLPEIASKRTHRVHTSFQQTVTATGRLSSTDPNLQNIPVRSDSGKRIRSAFIAKPGCKLIGVDYSQIELRILASMSKDPSLCEAFSVGEDIHTRTAAQIFGVNPEEVDSSQRRKAKAVNFGILYGKSAFSLAEELAISRSEASEIIEKYFARYPTIKDFLKGLVARARERGYAETLYGRRRQLSNLSAKNKMLVAMAERMAVNTPIQGTAADLMKIAMIEVHDELLRAGLKTKILLQVHDELVLESPDAEAKEAAALVTTTMKNAGKKAGFPSISVPLEVDCGIGENWLKI